MNDIGYRLKWTVEVEYDTNPPSFPRNICDGWGYSPPDALGNLRVKLEQKLEQGSKAIDFLDAMEAK